MPKNDEGEFELILGNRQLISVFLIVVVLLGVFFSMGYIVGRNSFAAGASEVARGDKSSSDSHPAEPGSPESSISAEPPADAAPTLPPAADEPASSGSPQSATHPEKPAGAPPAAKRVTPPVPETKPKPFPADATPAPERAQVAGQPAGGQYWQVVATSRPDAEIIAEALGKKGFHAVLSPAPKDGVFRVLVGPVGDASSQAQTRTNLEAAGFKNPILRKY